MSVGPRISLPPEQERPLRRAEFDRLVESGAFEDERIELLHGRLVLMRPQDAAHAGPIRRLTRLLGAALAGRADVRVQLPLAVSDESEPEPDLAVVPAADTDDAHPTTAMLVVEVARASLAIDRRVKAGLYAAAGVPDCRIVNLVDRTLEVHRDPDGAGYRSVATLRAGDSVAPHAFPDVTFGVSDILR